MPLMLVSNEDGAAVRAFATSAIVGWRLKSRLTGLRTPSRPAPARIPVRQERHGGLRGGASHQSEGTVAVLVAGSLITLVRLSRPFAARESLWYTSNVYQT